MSAHRNLIVSVLLVLFAVLLGGLSACASSDAASCETRDDCDDSQICTDGQCEGVPEDYCENDTDCESSDLYCSDNVCTPVEDNQNNEQPNQDPDNQDPDNQDPDNQDPDNQDPDNQDPDNQNNDTEGNPQVESVTPAEGEADVALDATIRVIFDQPIDDNFSLSTNAISLRTPSDQIVATDAEYFDDEREVVLTPDEELWPGTRYTVHVTSSVVSPTGMPLMDEVESHFSTEWDQPEEIQILAELYAPVIYQDTEETEAPDVHTDVPTRLDFAGSLEVAGNKDASQQGGAELPAHVYYSVNSTESHHFIHYILYYATRRNNSGELQEHDFSGIVVVVNRDTMDVELVDGVHTFESSRDDQRLGYLPNNSPVSVRQAWESSASSFDSADLIEGSRYPLYIPSGDHAACMWNEREDPGFNEACTGTPGEFRDDEGLIFRPGDTAQTVADAEVGDEGHPEVTYELLPYIDPFFTNAGDYSCGPFSSVGFTYDPGENAEAAGRPTGRSDSAALLPRSLCSEDDPSFGTLPFRWLRTSGVNSGGVWFLDPAWFLSGRFDFDDTLSQEYCYNFYFNIDRTEEEVCNFE